MRLIGARSIFLLMLVLLTSPHSFSQPAAQPPHIDVDDPADEVRLNRELWETMKGLPFAAVKSHLDALPRKTVEATVSLPNGWKIAPAGRQTPVGRLPYTAVPYAGRIVVLNTGYYGGNTKPEISIVDPDTGQVEKTVTVDALFPSAQESGGDLFVSGGFSRKVYRFNRNFELVRSYPISGYAGALAALEGSHLAVSCLVASDTAVNLDKGLYQKGNLALLDVETGTLGPPVALGYFPYALCHTHGKLYAAVLGENRVDVLDECLGRIKSLRTGASPQQIIADGDTLYVVNANSDSITVVDANRDEIRATIRLRGNRTEFGGAPTSLAADSDRLYATVANLNAIEVIDKRSRRSLGMIPTGWYPTYVLADGDRLAYLSAKGVRARRPNPRGPQPAPPPRGGPDYVLTLLTGTLGLIPKTEIDENLKGWTRLVAAGAPLAARFGEVKDGRDDKDSKGATGRGWNLLPGLEERAHAYPIRHIFYIVRENRTYDQVMGDLPRANGDPFLTLFGREVTPNGHRLADTFVTLDNYFADGEISVLGHSFTTSGYASPFLEWIANETYSGKYSSYPFGTVPGVMSPAYLWDALDSKHVDYRIYGENYFLYTRAYSLLRGMFGPDSAITQKFYARMMQLASVTDRGNLFYVLAHGFSAQARTVRGAEALLSDSGFLAGLSEFLCGDGSLVAALREKPSLRRKLAEYLARYCFGYRSWDLSYSDLDRFVAWKEDFEDQVRRRRVAKLHYIWLPNDHTAGAGPIPLPPDQFVAQNDAALGKIVETISHSPIWKESLILVTEDDAQNGPDHVDATRTVALAIGPYVKRGAIVSDRYDQLSLLRTIEVLLGLPPLNRSDALAAPMYGIFAEEPDFTPFERPELSSHLSAADRQRAEALR